MSWQERLQPASFRGVPFYVEQSTRTGGRRVVVHEYPGQETHDTEDLGLIAGRGRLQAFLVGADYDVARDKLLDALEREGVGTLVHPHYGSLSVRVAEIDTTITTRRGGYCSISFNYVLAGRGAPVFSPSTANAVIEAAAVCQANNNAAFQQNFTVTGQPEFVRNIVVDQINNLVSKIRAVLGKINAIKAQVEAVAQAIDEFGALVSDLILTPQALISAVQDIIASVIGAISDIGNAWQALKEFLGLAKTSSRNGVAADPDPAVISTTARNGVETDTRKRMAANQVAVSTAIVTGVITGVAIALTGDVSITTYDEAIALRDELLAEIDDLSTDDNLSLDEYIGLQDLASAIYTRINQLATGLQSVSYVHLKTQQPALVVAHQQYGEISNAAELIHRNRISNPLFLPADTAIEVLK